MPASRICMHFYSLLCSALCVYLSLCTSIFLTETIEIFVYWVHSQFVYPIIVAIMTVVDNVTIFDVTAFFLKEFHRFFLILFETPSISMGAWFWLETRRVFLRSLSLWHVYVFHSKIWKHLCGMNFCLFTFPFNFHGLHTYSKSYISVFI